MGVFTHGQLNITAITMRGSGLSLAGLVDAARANPYRTRNKPSSGWGDILDEDELPAGLSTAFRVRVTSHAAPNQNGTPVARLRRYYETANPMVRRLLGETAEWRQYGQRQALDFTIIDEGVDDTLTALVAAQAANMLKLHARPALEELMVDAGIEGHVVENGAVSDIDPDLFLWLLYKAETDRMVTPNIKLSEIASMNSISGPIWRTDYKRGATVMRVDIASVIAKESVRFGPAKFSFTHTSAAPEGFFEITLDPNWKFSALASSEYYDEEISEGLPSELRPRLVEDIWQIFIPTIIEHYQSDSAWNTKNRAKFIADCRQIVRKDLNIF